MKGTKFMEVERLQQPTAKMLFEELVEVIIGTFVATYESDGNTLIMRIPNGQKFSISVAEIQ